MAVSGVWGSTVGSVYFEDEGPGTAPALRHTHKGLGYVGYLSST